MKIFGNRQKNRDFDKTATFSTVSQQQIDSADGAGKKKKTGGSGKSKLPLTKGQKIRRVVLTLAVLLAVCGAGAAFWMSTVRNPSVAAVKTSASTVSQETGERVADYFTFIVGAVDQDQTRTDNLMVVGFDAKNKKINVLNIPRDTATVSDRVGASNKINAAYGTKNGIETTKNDIKNLIGFTPDYYMIVNFDGIAQIVDAIGGVDYTIPFRMYYKDPSQDLDIDFQPGLTHMDGAQVVEFLRWRKNNGGVKTGDSSYTGGDEQRIEKQQEFLKYLAGQVLSSANASKIPAIAKAVFANVKTDFSWGEILWMATQATGMDQSNLQMFTLPGYAAYAHEGSSEYLSYFFPNKAKTLAMVNQYFNPYQTALTALNIVTGPEGQADDETSDGASFSTTHHLSSVSSSTAEETTSSSKTTRKKTSTSSVKKKTRHASTVAQTSGETTKTKKAMSHTAESESSGVSANKDPEA